MSFSRYYALAVPILLAATVSCDTSSNEVNTRSSSSATGIEQNAGGSSNHNARYPVKRMAVPSSWTRRARPDRSLLVSRNEDGTLRAATGLGIELRGTEPTAILREFRDESQGLLAWDSISELELIHAHAPEPGRSRHLRFAQKVDGLPVYHGTLNLHLKDGVLTSFDSSLVALERVLPESTAETLPVAQAIAQLSPALGLDIEPSSARAEIFPLSLEEPSSARAEIFPLSRRVGERVWRVRAFPIDESHGEGPVELMLSAVDGRILRRISLVQHGFAPTHPAYVQDDVANQGDDASPCLTEDQLECSVVTTGQGDDGISYAMDLYRGSGFPSPPLKDAYLHPFSEEEYPDLIADASEDDTFFVDLSDATSVGGIYVIRSNGYLGNPYSLFFFDENDYIPAGPGPAFEDEEEYGAAVNAMTTIRQTLDYYQTVHGRRGIDDDPDRPLDIIARTNLIGLNASWVSDYNYIFFGSWLGNSVAVALDATAHELSHGVIGSSVELELVNQPGALNEALADMFAVLVQAEDTGRLDWWIGEDIPNFPPLRNLEHPEYFGMPGHMSEYNDTESDDGGVHSNMGIPSKAFQLAVDGTPADQPYHGYSVEPADADLMRSSRLIGATLYNVLTERLTPSANFVDWAVSMLAAVDDVGLSSNEADRSYQALRSALMATGILVGENDMPVAILTGRVLEDASGSPIQGADVVFTWSNNRFESTSDEEGVYRFVIDAASTSSASLEVSAGGYYPATEDVTYIVLPDATQDQLEADVRLVRRPPPQLYLSSPGGPVTLPAGGSTELSLELTNLGATDSELMYSITPKVDYSWGEVNFSWLDVSKWVEPVDLTGDQEHSDVVPLEKAFPFYFESFGSLYISTDGYVTFTPDDRLYYDGISLPDPNAPGNMVAPFWADLDFGFLERAYVYYDSTQATTYVQFNKVPDYLREFYYTFQMVLHPDGRIRLNYLEAPGTPESWSRIGLQDAWGEEGYEFVANDPDVATDFPRDRSSAEIRPSIPPDANRVSFDAPQEGSLMGGQSLSVATIISAEGLDAGNYSFRIRIDSNTPEASTIQVPIEVMVTN